MGLLTRWLSSRPSPPPIRMPDRLSRRFDLPRGSRFDQLIPRLQAQDFEIVEHGWRSDAFLLEAARDGVTLRFEGERAGEGRWSVRMECRADRVFPIGLVLEQVTGVLGWKDHWIVEATAPEAA